MEGEKQAGLFVIDTVYLMKCCQPFLFLSTGGLLWKYNFDFTHGSGHLCPVLFCFC